MKSRIILSAMLMTLILTGCRQSDWHDLFNGKDFTGFVQKGGEAQFTVEEGVMIGISTPDTPNSFMCTTEEYSDFILEFEVKVDTLLNSGVQIRSHSTNNGERTLVYGYQVEIDPTDRGWSGGIYDEARRGWLYPVTPNNAAAVRSLTGTAGTATGWRQLATGSGHGSTVSLLLTWLMMPIHQGS